MNEPCSDRRVVVITGGSDGIGAAAARLLARRGDRVVLVGRSPGKTRSAAAQIGAEGHVADFAHLGQVRELAAALVRQHPRIDVLVNNAGLIAGAQRTVTADGHELTFQVNHLAPFLLTMLLRDRLAAARASVITTSSQAGTVRGARLDPGDLEMINGYTGLRAYQSSKLANVLFTRELARRWEPLGVSARRGAPGHGPIAMGQIRTGSRPGSGELAFAAGHALTRTRRGHDRVAGDHHAGPRLDKRRVLRQSQASHAKPARRRRATGRTALGPVDVDDRPPQP